jgi:hypothetical protein
LHAPGADPMALAKTTFVGIGGVFIAG